ncbi:protein of unknown function [Candidatus Methylocalor cossyra]|uniref:Uncharacterized protein n=1 Tax=Candidatus Methylocalor cossyra TaxID=3108543 RepID=A0ABM9NJR3_9GAMM
MVTKWTCALMRGSFVAPDQCGDLGDCLPASRGPGNRPPSPGYNLALPIVTGLTQPAQCRAWTDWTDRISAPLRRGSRQGRAPMVLPSFPEESRMASLTRMGARPLRPRATDPGQGGHKISLAKATTSVPDAFRQGSHPHSLGYGYPMDAFLLRTYKHSEDSPQKHDQAGINRSRRAADLVQWLGRKR